VYKIASVESASLTRRRGSFELTPEVGMRGSLKYGWVVTIVLAVWILVCPGKASLAQGPGQDPDMTVDAAARSEVIETLVKRLNENYVFPEVAKKMEQAIRQRLQNKEYDSVTSARAFAVALTNHLQEVSHDKHLRVNYSFDSIPVRNREEAEPPEEVERWRRALRARNFGFYKVERLDGNVGYLDLRGFLPAEEAGETAAAAMNLLANCNAVVIDLRKNGGGAPSMVALLSSYLFDPEPVHLNDLYFRPNDSTHQWWTLAYVPGRRLGKSKAVYVLTSKRTFSAAEEFTYNLKSLKRATIVGETTGGGAHPGGGERLSEHFMAFVPSGRAINPITKTNWEGTGVKPDVEVAADDALRTAHLMALKKFLEKPEPNTPPMLLDEVKRTIATLEKPSVPETQPAPGKNQD
jgi:hypothetical protein